MTRRHSRLTAAFACLLTFVASAAGRTQAPAAAGGVEVFELRSRALEGNLAGDSPVRDVSVYLPASYGTDTTRRYPVVYLLHGFTDTDAKWFGRAGEHWIHLPQVLNRASARADVAETIVVMPNGFNAFGGSFYSTSITIGDWESFVADELVAAIDSRYRTLAARASRGLAGHSMGGYGAIRLGMARPDVFSAVYAMSACCLTPVQAPAAASGPSPAESISTLAQAAAAPFGVKAALALSAAWSPNPDRPPLYLDLPTESGRARPDVLARFAANAPVALVPQRVFALRRLTALGIDVGTRDRLQSESAAFDRALTHYGIPHVYQTYDGDHIDGVAARIEAVVMPFFARHLVVR